MCKLICIVNCSHFIAFLSILSSLGGVLRGGTGGEVDQWTPFYTSAIFYKFLYMDDGAPTGAGKLS